MVCCYIRDSQDTLENIEAVLNLCVYWGNGEPKNEVCVLVQLYIFVTMFSICAPYVRTMNEHKLPH